jgi:hypothetical protein
MAKASKKTPAKKAPVKKDAVKKTLMKKAVMKKAPVRKGPVDKKAAQNNPPKRVGSAGVMEKTGKAKAKESAVVKASPKVVPADGAQSSSKPPMKAKETPSILASIGKVAGAVAQAVTQAVTVAEAKKSKPRPAEKPGAGVAESAPKAKRGKSAAAGEGDGRAVAVDEATRALEQRWQTLQKQSSGKPAPDYDMTKTYESKSPLQHKVLGWGYILENKNDRLEVLFRSGIKILISNYKT